MAVKFICKNQHKVKNTTEIWNGTILYLHGTPNHYEMKMEARGSTFYIIFGKYTYGNYISIPNWNVGCDLSTFSDTFWNQERLSQFLGKIDAISVTCALRAADKFVIEQTPMA